MKRIVLIILFSLIANPAFCEDSNNTETQLLDKLKLYCEQDKVDYESITNRAISSGLTAGKSGGFANGPVSYRAKHWVGKLSNENFVLDVEELKTAKIIDTVCDVGGQISDVDHYRSTVIKKFNLSDDVAPKQSMGEKTYIWEPKDKFGIRTLIKDSNDKPNDFVEVSLVHIEPNQNSK